MYNILTDGELVQLFSIFKDGQNTFIQKVIKSLPDIIYIMNLDTQAVIYSSRLLASEIGYAPHEIDEMENPILDVMHQDDRERFILHLQDVKNSKPGEVVSIEFRLVTPAGKIAWFIDRNSIFTHNTDGSALTKIGITHEITRRKEQELHLIKNKSIMDISELLAGTGSWEYQKSSESFTWSPGMYVLFNLPRGTKVKPSIYKDYSTHDDLAIAERVVNAIENEQSSFDEILHITVDGKILAVKIKAARVENGKSDGRVLVGVDMDITFDEQKEQELIKLTTSLENNSREISLLHHDLKTFAEITATDYNINLKNIYTAFELIVKNEAQHFSNTGKAAIRKIQGSIQRMNLLTSDIHNYLSISQKSKAMNKLSLDEVISYIIGELKYIIEEQNIIINKGKIGFVVGDFQLLNILFKHLIDNAIKFRKPDQQTIINIGSNLPDGAESNNDEPVTGSLHVSVEDNGLGFAAEEVNDLYELFYKNHKERKLKGSGVGLAIAKRIMTLHGGYITAESKVNEGSKFTCIFPTNGKPQ